MKGVKFGPLGKISLAKLVLIYFSGNMDEEMSAADIAEKFDDVPGEVNQKLEASVRCGLLAKREPENPTGRGNSPRYMAGPVLCRVRGFPPRVWAEDGETEATAPVFDPHALGLLVQACASFAAAGNLAPGPSGAMTETA